MIALGVMAMASESALRSTALQLAGDCALLMASFSWSAYGLLARKIGWSPAHSASIVAVLSMCAYVPVFVLVSPLSGFGAAAWREIALQVVFQGVLIGAVSIFVYSKSVAVLGAARTASLSAAVPCVTTLGASLLLRETPSLISLVGVALVTAGMLVSLQCNNAARSGRCLERS
jgi:drug/metabolite transporter (DMT)-like permease